MTLLFETEVVAKFDFECEEEAQKIIKYTLDYLKVPYEAEINLTLTDNPGIHELNKEYRDIDRPTDVLSFPLVDYPEPLDFSIAEQSEEDYFNPDTGELLLGDIVISVDKVREQAAEYGHAERREYCFLIVHSMLHLLGYDHMEDNERAVMEKLQKEILDSAGIVR